MVQLLKSSISCIVEKGGKRRCCDSTPDWVKNRSWGMALLACGTLLNLQWNWILTFGISSWGTGALRPAKNLLFSKMGSFDLNTCRRHPDSGLNTCRTDQFLTHPNTDPTTRIRARILIRRSVFRHHHGEPQCRRPAAGPILGME